MVKQSTRNAPGDSFSGGDTDVRKREEIAAEIETIQSMSKEQLRVRWKDLFRKDVPKALTKDLLARMIAYRIQEKVFGGLDRKTEKILESYANGKPTDASRHLKSGTVVVREYQGVRHTVTITDGEYLWNGKRYASLSTIAKEITGTSWNGPRFFGLREDASKEPNKGGNTTAREARS